MAKIKKVPFEEQVANSIIKALEDGTAPWVKPWKGSQLSDMEPINIVTNKPYNGINFVNLVVTAMHKGYSDPRWMTFNQAKSVGAKVLKGEKATLVKFYKFTEKREVLDENGEPKLDEKGKPIKEEVKLENPKVIYHYVFNAMQCENVPELEKDETKETQREFEAVDAAEKILQNSGADIRHLEGNRAYYSPLNDFIVLPTKEQFIEVSGEMGYYSTALHELGHWTGHESRLNRDFGGKFGTQAYAKEELRAEIASFMMCSKLGLDFDPQQHYAYVGSWIKTLQDDPKEIIRASRDAMKITNYIIDLQKEKTMHQEKENNISEILSNTIEQGNPYELIDGRVIMEHLEGENIDNTKSKGLYIFIGEAGDMKPKTAISSDKAIIMIKNDLLQRVAKEADKIGYSVMDNEDKESSYTIFDDSGLSVMTGSYIDVKSALKELPNLRDESMTQHLKREIAKLNRKSNNSNNITEDANLLKETLINDKINLKEINDKKSIEAQLSELRNTIIYAQSEMLNEKLEPYSKLVLESTLPKLKEIEVVLEKNLNTESNYSKEILQQHQKIIKQENRDTLFTEKTYLIVKYEEKEEAKRAGAKWDKEAKSWYAPIGSSKEKLNKWTFEQKNNYSNTQKLEPAEEFKEILEKNGFVIDGLPKFDGKIHRIDVVTKPNGNKNGWYLGFNDGRPNAVFGDYTKGQNSAKNGLKWKSMSSEFNTGYDPTKAKELKAQYAVKKEKAEKELLKEQLKTADILAKEFKEAQEADDKHSYLVAKGVKNHNLKVDKRGNLLMPLQDIDGKIWTLQRIGKTDKKSGKTFKMIGVIRTKEEKSRDIKYPSKMDGTFFIIDKNSFANAKQIIISEGYSTGATVHEATKLPVVVAVHSGNIEKVAISLSKKYPQKQILIAGDNDLLNELNGKENIGKIKAQLAAIAVKGEVALPTFTKEELTKGASDWNDLAKNRGLKEVKKQLDIALNRLKNRETSLKNSKTQEQNQTQNKIRRREVVRKQSLSIGK